MGASSGLFSLIRYCGRVHRGFQRVFQQALSEKALSWWGVDSKLLPIGTLHHHVIFMEKGLGICEAGPYPFMSCSTLACFILALDQKGFLQGGLLCVRQKYVMSKCQFASIEKDLHTQASKLKYALCIWSTALHNQPQRVLRKWDTSHIISFFSHFQCRRQCEHISSRPTIKCFHYHRDGWRDRKLKKQLGWAWPGDHTNVNQHPKWCVEWQN